jgi:hypothetical protein
MKQNPDEHDRPNFLLTTSHRDRMNVEKRFWRLALNPRRASNVSSPSKPAFVMGACTYHLGSQTPLAPAAMITILPKESYLWFVATTF